MNEQMDLQPTDDDRLWGMLGHISQIIFAIVGPLIVRMTKGSESPYVKAHAKRAINFGITYMIVFFLAFAVFIVTVSTVESDPYETSPVIPIVFMGMFMVNIAAYILCAIAAVKAYHGKTFHYPAIPFLR